MAPAIEILTSVAGDDFSWRPGEVIEVDQATADRWADGYRARLVDAQPPDRETATQPVPEKTTASRPAARSRGRTRSAASGDASQ